MGVSSNRAAAAREAVSGAESSSAPSVSSASHSAAAGDGTIRRVIENTASRVPLPDLPSGILSEITQRLEVRDTLTLVEAYPDIGNLYTPEQIAWLDFEKASLNLIHGCKPGDVQRKAELKNAYQQILLKLFDQKTGNSELKRMATLAEKFHQPLSRLEIKALINGALSQQQAPYHLQIQLGKLARINLGLCVSLCCSATFAQLAQYGIMNHDFLSGRLPIDRQLAEDFLHGMERSYSHNSALLYAVYQQSLPVVSALLQANPESIEQLDFAGGGTALMPAVSNGDSKMVRLLLEHGANVNSRDTHHATTLVKIASAAIAEERAVQIAQMLLNHGAEVESQEESGFTALMRACQRGNADMVRLLLQHGAKPDTKTNGGMDALFIARATGAEDIVQILENHRQSLAS